MNTSTTDIIISKRAWNYKDIPFIFPCVHDKTPKKRNRKTPTDTNAPEMVTIKELSNRTGLSESYIRKLCKTNQIQYIKTGGKIFN